MRCFSGGFLLLFTARETFHKIEWKLAWIEKYRWGYRNYLGLMLFMAQVVNGFRYIIAFWVPTRCLFDTLAWVMFMFHRRFESENSSFRLNEYKKQFYWNSTYMRLMNIAKLQILSFSFWWMHLILDESIISSLWAIKQKPFQR